MSFLAQEAGSICRERTHRTQRYRTFAVPGRLLNDELARVHQSLDACRPGGGRVAGPDSLLDSGPAETHRVSAIPVPCGSLRRPAGGASPAHHRAAHLTLPHRARVGPAVCAAFSETDRHRRGSTRPPKRIVLILDASLSMRAVHQGVTLFARAQAEAADVLRALESGTEAAVSARRRHTAPLASSPFQELPGLA